MAVSCLGGMPTLELVGCYHFPQWHHNQREKHKQSDDTVSLRRPRQQHGCWHCSRSAFQTLHTWLIVLPLRHGAGDTPLQPLPPAPSNSGSDWARTTADLQTAYQHTVITTCHLYIFQPGLPPPCITPRPRCHGSWYHFLWEGKFTLSIFFCHAVDIYQPRQGYLWEGAHRDRTGSHTVGG